MTTSPSWINLSIAGGVLLFIGIVGLVLALIFAGIDEYRRRQRELAEQQRQDQRQQARIIPPADNLNIAPGDQEVIVRRPQYTREYR